MTEEQLPLKIEDSEKVARAIFHPYHIKKNKIKPAAFKAKAGRKDVSVNRLTALTPTECKQKAKSMEKTSGHGQKKYIGFAVITALKVREIGSDVIDSRDAPNYFGHADIIHDFILEKNEPPPPEINYKLRKMADQSIVYIDPAPQEPNWTGEPIL